MLTCCSVCRVGDKSFVVGSHKLLLSEMLMTLMMLRSKNRQHKCKRLETLFAILKLFSMLNSAATVLLRALYSDAKALVQCLTQIVWFKSQSANYCIFHAVSHGGTHKTTVKLTLWQPWHLHMKSTHTYLQSWIIFVDSVLAYACVTAGSSRGCQVLTQSAMDGEQHWSCSWPSLCTCEHHSHCSWSSLLFGIMHHIAQSNLWRNLWASIMPPTQGHSIL